ASADWSHAWQDAVPVRVDRTGRDRSLHERRIEWGEPGRREDTGREPDRHHGRAAPAAHPARHTDPSGLEVALGVLLDLGRMHAGRVRDVHVYERGFELDLS